MLRQRNYDLLLAPRRQLLNRLFLVLVQLTLELVHGLLLHRCLFLKKGAPRVLGFRSDLRLEPVLALLEHHIEVDGELSVFRGGVRRLQVVGIHLPLLLSGNRGSVEVRVVVVNAHGHHLGPILRRLGLGGGE